MDSGYVVVYVNVLQYPVTSTDGCLAPRLVVETTAPSLFHRHSHAPLQEVLVLAADELRVLGLGGGPGDDVDGL